MESVNATLQMNLKMLRVFFFPLEHSQYHSLVRWQFPEKQEWASLTSVRPSCCPCFHSGARPWLKVENHFPNCAKKWGLKRDVVSANTQTSTFEPNVGSSWREVPQRKACPGKVSPGKGSMRRRRRAVGSTQAGWSAFPPRPLVRSLPAGLSAEPPCCTRAVLRLES